jgi:gliding motility-associated-like protein
MKQLFRILVFSLLIFPVKGSHIVGGDIYYDYLGNNQYRIYISVFRDCLSNGADFDSPLPLGIFMNSNNALVQSINVPYTGKTNVPVTFNNPCVVPPSNICTENSIYTTIVTLPPTPDGYRIAYVRCCRGPNINNLVYPEDTGLTLTVNIPGVANNAYQNSSPRFNNYPPMLLCNNDDLVFNHSATDPDGDQLVYSLSTPYRGGTTNNPMPTPTPAPPYSPVTWSGGFSQLQPLGPGSSISINSSTGILTADPNLTGRFVVGIRVDEYRDGVLISSMTRDFIFRVFNCNITMQAILPLETSLPSYTGYCKGNLNVQFVNNSYGGTNYLWDFGDPTTTDDVSTVFAPSYNYSDTGKYVAMLVVNPGWPCTDTAYMEINLYNALNADITHTDSVCLLNNQFDFSATSDGPPGTQYNWSFGANSTSSAVSGTNASTHFTTEGQHQVILTTTFAVCEVKDTVTVYVIPQPVASFEMPSNYECDGLEVSFVNNTQNAFNHFWNFGVNEVTSTERSPTFEFPAGGTYTVNYYASSSPECVDSMQVIIHVNEKLAVSFSQSPDQCIGSNVFDFVGEVEGPVDATYYYTFGSGTNNPTVPGTDVLGLSFNSPGTHTVTLTGQFDNCIETYTSQVFVYSEPTIGFGMQDGLQCVPFLAQFTNYSTADSDMFFEWDFGDGHTSNEIHPNHLYTEHGQFPVTLHVATAEGCIDTLFMTRVDLIDINPKPIAAFITNKTETDICHPVVQFTNTSQGAVNYYYDFDDGYAFSEEENPGHYFYLRGDHYVYMIATSEKGCTDTVHQKIYVEPFSVFIPNTFTPNADEFNSVFRPKMWLEPFEWELRIYNRWGEQIFTSFDYQAVWDGTYNGQIVPFGLYSYTLKYRPCSMEDHIIVKNGHINVIR